MEAAKAPEKGNPAFRLTPDAEKQALDDFEKNFATITDEDIQLEETLQAQVKQAPLSDNAPALEVRKTKDNVNHLKDISDTYTPANSHADLLEQVHLAKENGCDSIDGTPSLVRATFRRDYEHIEKHVGYGIFHDVRVYIDGYFDKNKDADKMTMSEKLEKR